MRTIALFMIPVGLIFADETKSTKATKSTNANSKTQPTAQPAAKSGSITIPADAEEIAPHVYRAKDAGGKTWIYRQTPFGISKMEDRTGDIPPQGQQAPAPVPGDSTIKVKAFDRGDSVRFEQGTPMGNRVWERKKSELTPQERAWLEQANNDGKESAKPEK